MGMGIKIVTAKWEWEGYELKSIVSAVHWRCALYIFSRFRSRRPRPQQ